MRETRPGDWSGDYTLTGSLTFSQGPLQVAPVLPSRSRSGWDPDLGAVYLTGGTGDGVLELFLRCPDVSCAEVNAVRLSVPVKREGPVRSVRVGVAPEQPLAWRALAVGAEVVSPAQDGAHVVGVARVDDATWRFSVAPRPSAEPAGGFVLRAEIILSADRERPPWRTVAVQVTADVGSSRVRGGWLLS